MTDAEFEYEFLQDVEYRNWLEEIRSNTNIDTQEGKFERQFSMSDAEYEHISEMNERDEFVDFEIPADAPSGKRYSDMQSVSDETDSEFEPVDMEQMFGGD